MTNTVVLNKLVCVMLGVRIWSGRRRLHKRELKLINDDEIPPDELVSLGSKKIYDLEKLKVFGTLKKQAERACLKYGTRFLGGFAIPLDKKAELVATLDAIAKDFEQARADLIASYDTEANKWAAKHPRWENVIRDALLPVSEVKHRTHFGYIPFQISPDSVEGDMESELEGLGGVILREIAEEASKMIHDAGKRDKTRTNTISKLQSIADKLQGLAFVSPAVAEVSKWLSKEVSVIGNATVLTGAEHARFMKIVGALATPESAFKSLNLLAGLTAVTDAAKESATTPVTPAINTPSKPVQSNSLWFA